VKRCLCSLLFFDCTEHFIILYSCIIIIHQGVYNNECDCRTQIIIIIIVITISHDDVRYVIIIYRTKKSFLHTSMTQKIKWANTGQDDTRYNILFCSSIYPFITYNRYIVASAHGIAGIRYQRV